MKADALACRECGDALVRPPSGRPPKYCSQVCRRAAEYGMRRIQALLRRAERYRQDAQLALHVGESWQAKTVQRRLDFWDAEIARLQRELRVMLAGGAELPDDYPRVAGP